MQSGDNIVIIAWGLQRLVNSVLEVMCKNILRGVGYRFYLPNISPEVLQGFVDSVKMATSMPPELLEERLEIVILAQSDMHTTLDEYVVVVHDGMPIAGWQFPLPSNHEYVFNLNDDDLLRVVRLIRPYEGARVFAIK